MAGDGHEVALSPADTAWRLDLLGREPSPEDAVTEWLTHG
jgi:hypothetical protein